MHPVSPGHRVPLVVVHLTASPCFGGTERQMLELGRELRGTCRSVFVSFLEEGRCWDFINAALREGREAYALEHDTPRILAALSELLILLRRVEAKVLCCHGYKANLLGWIAARRLGIPIVSVSHGWTGESLRVRVFEALDRWLLRCLDKVVCVSEGQAQKVRRAGVPGAKVQVIRDAVCADRFTSVEPEYRERLESMFSERPSVIVGAAGRLSPEKGFGVLIDAAAQVLNSGEPGAGSSRSPLREGTEVQSGARGASSGLSTPCSAVSRASPRVAFVLFGDGRLRADLEAQIADRGLTGRFCIAGFHSDLDRYFPNLDLFVQSSYTEGLPNVVLEAYAAGVPVVATAVGGTPEVVQDGINGYLVPPGNATALAKRIADMLSDLAGRREMGARGHDNVRQVFSFAQQAREYRQLFDSLLPRRAASDRCRPRLPIAVDAD